MNTKIAAALCAGLAVAALSTAAPATAAPGDTTLQDTLPSSAVPTFGDDQAWQSAATSTRQVRGRCIPLLPRGAQDVATRTHRLPGTGPAVRSAQTVAEYASPAAARAAALEVVRRATGCGSRTDTRTFPTTPSPTTRLVGTITVTPGEDEGYFGYIGVGWRGDRMTVAYFGHPGQDSNFPQGTFEEWVRSATSRLG